MPKPKIEMLQFASRLRQHRKAAGMSMRELSLRAGLAHTLVYYVEGQHRNPTWDTVLRLCRALGVTPNDFL